MVYATLADVQLMYEGTIATTDEPRVEEYLASAARRLDILVPSVAARITAGSLDADIVKDVVRDAVLRRLRNPQGYQGEHAGDYGYYYGSAGDAASAKAAARVAPFTPAEIDQLRESSTSGAPRSIRVTTPFDGSATPSPWY